MPDPTALQRSAVLRWLLAVPFGLLGALGVAAAVASGLLTLPGGVLLLAVAVWLAAGADPEPAPGLRWTLAISGGLTALAWDLPAANVVQGTVGETGKPVFVFSGYGSQWVGMGRELAATSKVFSTLPFNGRIAW